MNHQSFIAACMAICLGLLGLVPHDAAARDWGDDDHSYDRARRAVDQGEAKPVAELLELLKQHQPGQVIEIEFEREHGLWVYEFKLIAPDGRLLEIYMDAHSGELLSVEED